MNIFLCFGNATAIRLFWILAALSLFLRYFILSNVHTIKEMCVCIYI